MKNKNALGPVVATALFIIVVVISVITYQGWFSTYQSKIFTNAEKKELNLIDLNYLDSGNTLYIKNSDEENLSFIDIKINSVSCLINGTLEAGKLNQISLDECTSGMPLGPKEITIVTNEGIYSKYMMLKSVEYIPSEGFTGYAWGEQFGYISFYGSEYRVLLTEDNVTFYGKAYSEYLGFISFNSTSYSVINSSGILTGYAWGENCGYISFNGTGYQTTFNGSHIFGNAYSENYGYIHFNYPTFYQPIYLNN